MIVGVKNFAPVENDRLFIFQAEEIQIGLICKAARAVKLADPHRHRRAVGDQPEALFALTDAAFGNHALRGLDNDGDHPRRLARFVQDRGIVQIHPDLFGMAMPVERELLILVCKRAAARPTFMTLSLKSATSGQPSRTFDPSSRRVPAPANPE